jgi:MFS family permease
MIIRDRLRSSALAARSVFRTPDLRRLQGAHAVEVTAGWGYAVALYVYAAEQGGATAVGLVGLLTMVPAALVAPFAALAVDRLRREVVLIAAMLTRGVVLLSAAAAVWADLPPAVVYALAVVGSIAARVYFPAVTSLIPALAPTPEALSATNVVSSAIESIGTMVGPALSGLLLVVFDPAAVFALAGACHILSLPALRRIRTETSPVPREHARPSSAFLGGFRVVLGDSGLRAVVGLYTVQTLVAGALTVFVVVAALDLLDLGEPGVGFLNAALGLGGLVGGIVAIALAERGRLAGDLALGVVLWGVPLALVGVWPDAAPALLLFAVVGLANTVVDVSAFTLLQRTVPQHVHGRVFGLLEGLSTAAVGLGAILAPAMIAGLGVRGALVAAGTLLPAATVFAWLPLTQLDARAVPREREVELLRQVPFLARLDPASLDALAAGAEPVQLTPGAQVFRQGDLGDRFYVVDSGSVDVIVDGDRRETLRTGGFFGEIALLRDVPRTATVTAPNGVHLLAIDRQSFLDAVTGTPESAGLASSVVAVRLGSGRARTLSF